LVKAAEALGTDNLHAEAWQFRELDLRTYSFWRRDGEESGHIL
jgi:hypothetical protein